MSKYSNMGRVAKCGSPDSKYFGNPEQFEKDLAEKFHKAEILRQEVADTLRNIVLQDPSKVEDTYHLIIKELIKIKAEFDI